MLYKIVPAETETVNVADAGRSDRLAVVLRNLAVIELGAEVSLSAAVVCISAAVVDTLVTRVVRVGPLPTCIGLADIAHRRLLDTVEG